MMMKQRLLLCMCAFTVSACGGAEETDHGPESAAPASPSGVTPQSDEHAHEAADPTQEPQPLLAIMQRLGTDMTTLTHALMTDDYEAVRSAAAAIAQHPPIASEDLQRIQARLGDELHAFEEVDRETHAASLRLREAAEQREPQAVLARLNDVQRGCVACHQRFRERLLTSTNR